jgi:hypothetical protein
VDAGRLGGTRLGAGSLRIFSNTVAALIDHHCVGVAPVSDGDRTAESICAEQRPGIRQDASREKGQLRPQATL